MPDYGLSFNPSQMSLAELTNTPMTNQAMGMFGSGLPQNMSGVDIGKFQQGVSQAAQSPMAAMQAMQDKANQMDMYKMAAGALQGMSKPQQQAQNPIQIIRDQNQFRFAGMQQNPQMLANALRNRG